MIKPVLTKTFSYDLCVAVMLTDGFYINTGLEVGNIDFFLYVYYTCIVLLNVFYNIVLDMTDFIFGLTILFLFIYTFILISPSFM